MKKPLLFLALLFASFYSHAQYSNRNIRSAQQNLQNAYAPDIRPTQCNGNCACGGRAFYYEAMPDADFRAALHELKAQSFDVDKLQMGKYIISNSYTLTRQVVALANQFSFSDSKKQFLIAAYPTCLDKNLYFQAVNTLSFSKDKAQVWAAIEDIRRQ